MVDAEQVSEIKPAIVLRIPPVEQEVGGAARLPGIGRRQIEKPVEGLDDGLAHPRILSVKRWPRQGRGHDSSLFVGEKQRQHAGRSEEHTSELQSLMRISYAVFSLKKQT